jgi:hypothetical protein
MIARPHCLTPRPEFGPLPAGVADAMPLPEIGRGRMAADVLSDLLKTVRLTGAAFFEIVAEAPWAVASPPREMILPRILPDADHLIAYHAVTAGRCVATVAGRAPIELEAGEVVVSSPMATRTSCRAARACAPNPPRPTCSTLPPPHKCRS